MPAPLETFLAAWRSGQNVLTPEMYEYFGGDAMLEQLRKYDPNATFTDTATYGGEGGDGPMGKRLDFDITKLPSVQGIAPYDLILSNAHERIKDPSKVYDDPNYGSVTKVGNFYKDPDAKWTKFAPLFVSLLAPMAGGALAAAGIGAGATAGVTGAAAGLGAGNIAMGGKETLLTQLMRKVPNLARQVGDNPNGITLQSLLPLLLQYGGQAAGVNPNIVKGGLTLAQLAKQQRRRP